MILSIILLEDISFEELVTKLEMAFHIDLPYENKKGRLVAEGANDIYSIELIDRVDELSESLCDEYFVLDLSFDDNECFDYDKYEFDIKAKLKNGDIKWRDGIWAPWDPDGEARSIYPDK